MLGAVGALCRHGLGTWIKGHLDSAFPLPTLVVNVLGSFLLGLLTALAIARVVPESWRGPLAIGFLGSLTTWSTFGLETVLLVQRGQLLSALANVGLQLALGLSAAAGGLWLGRLVAP